MHELGTNRHAFGMRGLLRQRTIQAWMKAEALLQQSKRHLGIERPKREVVEVNLASGDGGTELS